MFYITTLWATKNQITKKKKKNPNPKNKNTKKNHLKTELETHGLQVLCVDSWSKVLEIYLGTQAGKLGSLGSGLM